MCDKKVIAKRKRDSGGGGSICGSNPSVNVSGSYWLCGECVAERLFQPHCGHPMSSVVQVDEGTAWCSECEDKARMESHMHGAAI